jgi:hypothetical protein
MPPEPDRFIHRYLTIVHLSQSLGIGKRTSFRDGLAAVLPALLK